MTMVAVPSAPLMAMELSDEIPTALYRLFDSAGVLLYVGISDNLKVRFADHAASKPWWPDVARRTIELHTVRSAAEAAEDAAIKAEHPVHNLAGVPSDQRFPKVRPEMPPFPAWTAGESEVILDGIRRTLGRSELSRPHRLMAIMNILLTGSPDLPSGAALVTLAGYNGVSRDMAFKALRAERHA